MKIFKMNTIENVDIPILMVKYPLTIDMINTQGLTPDGLEDVQYTHDLNNMAGPELTQHWFDATNDELLTMMNENALGYVLYKAGGVVTLPAVESFDDIVYMGISPYGSISYNQNGNSETYTVSQSSGAYGNFGEVTMWPSKKTSFTNSQNMLRLSIQVYQQMRRVGDPITVSATQSTVRINTLIRDHTGATAVVILTTTNYLNGNEPLPEQLKNKVMVKSVYTSSTPGISGTLRTNQTFWREQTESEPAEPEDGVGIVDITNRFSPRTAASMLGIYPITKEQLRDFSLDLWSTSFTEKFIYNIMGDPVESIVGLRWYYGILNNIKRTEQEAYLTLGNVRFNGVLGSEVAITTKPAASEYLTYTCGEIQVQRHFNNFLDYSPFTQVQVFVPWYGFVSLDANEVMGGIIRLDYNINLMSGATIAYLYLATGTNEYRILMQ